MRTQRTVLDNVLLLEMSLQGKNGDDHFSLIYHPCYVRASSIAQLERVDEEASWAV